MLELVPAAAIADYTPGRVIGPCLSIWVFSALLKSTLTVSRLCPVSFSATRGPSNFSAESHRDRATTTPLDIESFKSFTFFYTEKNNQGQLNCQEESPLPSWYCPEKQHDCVAMSHYVCSWHTPFGLSTVQWECAPARRVPSWSWTVVLCGKQRDGLL